MSVSVCLCVFVCPRRSYVRNYTPDLHQISCACYRWPWLGPPLLLSGVNVERRSTLDKCTELRSCDERR